MHITSRHHQSAAGFTLLEAIVSIAIIGFALVPLAIFIAQAANQLARAADANERSFATQSALALADIVNPMEEPAGELPLEGNTSVSWQSQEIIPPNDGVLVGAGLPAFRVGFYRMTVTLKRGAEPWFDFELRKVGYRRINSTIPFSSGLGPQ